jgi:16S rRNA (uracil1498-N3)-methyltransferase
MTLFYSKELSEKQIVLPPEESKHLLKVLRAKKGDTVLFTDGKGHLAKTILDQENIKGCICLIHDISFFPPDPKTIHLAVSTLKNHNRFEWLVEKAVELGVNRITPIICERTEKPSIRRERLEKIMISAMKQSERLYLPHLAPPEKYNTFLSECNEPIRVIPHCAEGKKEPVNILQTQYNSVVFLIGPEGDFTATEIDLAMHHGFVPVTLGKARLRTETAAIALLSFLAVGGKL